jgi:hypothetical protein
MWRACLRRGDDHRLEQSPGRRERVGRARAAGGVEPAMRHPMPCGMQQRMGNGSSTGICAPLEGERIGCGGGRTDPDVKYCRTSSTAPATSAVDCEVPVLISSPKSGRLRSSPHLHRDWARPCRICAETGLALPHLRRDWARPCRICTRTGLTPATSAPRLGSSRPCHICAGTGLTPATSAPGLGRSVGAGAALRRGGVAVGARSHDRCTGRDDVRLDAPVGGGALARERRDRWHVVRRRRIDPHERLLALAAGGTNVPV